jgi:hypothetical protein
MICTGTGFVSGFISGLGQYFLPEHQLIVQTYPALILGIFLFLCGYYVFRISISNPLLSCINLIFFSIIGWRASIDIGYELGGPVPFLTAGMLGAFFVALGWLLSWNIRSDVIKFILIISLSGAIGGLVFQLTDKLFDLNEEIWTFTLLIEWQIILFTGIVFAYKRLKMLI